MAVEREDLMAGKSGEIRCTNVAEDVVGAVEIIARKHGLRVTQWVMRLIMREVALELDASRQLVNLMNAPHATRIAALGVERNADEMEEGDA